MKLQQNQCTVTKVVQYSETVNNLLKPQYIEETEKTNEIIPVTFGGTLSDTDYTWLCNGPRLEILSTKTGVKVAGWTFGSILRDSYTKISCVVDLPSSNASDPMLVVGLHSGLNRGMVCVFDIRNARVLRAIQIDMQVTSIHVVDSGCDTSLPGSLRALDGILAVGTDKGIILLIDLCRQACDEAAGPGNTEYIRDEITACELRQLSILDLPMLEKHKELALKTGDHLCIQLNEGCTSENFILKGPRGESRLRVNIDEVKISALHYCPQLGSLLVGYNFGAFQLYNLLTIKLEYTSPVYEDYIPVSHFTIQEPCDDPRSCCYVWVVYSNTESGIPGFPLAVMYALTYNSKEYLEGYGSLYQELSSCSIRFQTDLTALPGSKLNKAIGANCVSLMGYTRGNQKQNSQQDVPEEHLALCAVIWTVWNATDSETYMCLFDLNQWYKEQMPSSPSEDNGSYMVFLSLTDLFLSSTNYNSNLLDVKLDPKSITPFICAQRLEEHYFPNALAFNLICAREEDIIFVSNPGVQKYLLSCIKIAGPLCLLRPSDIYLKCLSMGLTPLHMDVDYNSHTPITLQREMILCVALEHQLISWLCQCAQEWSNGSHSSAGCTLDFLINWAWQRANILKTNVSQLCEPLFDYSGMRLDQNSHTLLNHCAKQITNLTSVYEHIVQTCTRFLSEEGLEEINHQYKTLKMLSVYLEVLQWLLNVGLLPECPLYMYPRPDESERLSAPYPVESLTRFYKDRRQELFELQGTDCVKDSQSCDLLFIDNLIALECGGQILQDEWKADSGCGLYPPPSLQALLRTYLIEDVDLVIKHCIFIYVFLDLAMTLDQSRYTPIITHLIKFPAVFKLNPSIIKITQAFWQLDHGDFSTAMAQLLDPLVSNEDLQLWHHRVALKALLAQGQHQHALLYHKVRQPPTINLQDLCITVTLLIVNDLLQEAFQFQRENRSECNEKELLQHFMEACDKTNQLVHVLQLSLMDVEERALIQYLTENQREDTENYLIQYFLQRSRFAEAFESNDRLNTNMTFKQGLIGQQELNSRNSLVRQYKCSLPHVTQELLNYFSTQKPQKTWTTRDKPFPLSVVVHDTQDKLRYKSTLIEASFQKTKETWTGLNKSSNEIPFMSTPKRITPKEQQSTPLIYPAVIEPLNLLSVQEEDGPTPNKRRKVTSRQPIGSCFDKQRKSITVGCKSLLLSTPIVKRKTVRSRTVSSSRMFESFAIGSPQSILKVRKLVRNSASPIDGNSTTPELIDSDDGVQPIDKASVDKIKSTYVNLADYSVSTPSKTLTPRKTISRTPKQAVRFQDSRASTPSDEGIEEQIEVDVQIETPSRSSILQSGSEPNSKNSSMEEKFYSPNSSSDKSMEIDKSVEKEIPIILEQNLSKPISTPRNTRKRKINENSVQSRRSYKSDLDQSSLNESIPDKSSLSEINTTNTSASYTEIEQVPETLKKHFPKVCGRKSLTRQVLEQNTIAKALSSPRMQTRSTVSRLPNLKNASGVELSHSKTITSSKIEKVGGNVIEDSTITNTYESKNLFTTETDPITSAQTIKHVHNEISTKTNKKVTEILEPINEVANLEKSHVLLDNSRVDMDLINADSLEDSEIEEENEESMIVDAESEQENILSDSSSVDMRLINIEYSEDSQQEEEKEEPMNVDSHLEEEDDILSANSYVDEKLINIHYSEEENEGSDEEVVDQEVEEEEIEQELLQEIQGFDEESSSAQTEDSNQNSIDQNTDSSDSTVPKQDQVIEILSSSEDEMDELKIVQTSDEDKSPSPNIPGSNVSGETDKSESPNKSQNDSSEQSKTDSELSKSEKTISEISQNESRGSNIFEKNIQDSNISLESQSARKNAKAEESTETLSLDKNNSSSQFSKISSVTQFEIKKTLFASKPIRSTRASSVVPKTSTEVNRQKRGQSIEPNVLNEELKKSYPRTSEPMETEDIHKPGTSKESPKKTRKTSIQQTIESNEALEAEQALIQETKSNDAKTITKIPEENTHTPRRGRSSSVQPEDPIERSESPMLTRTRRSVAPTNVESPKPVRRGRKSSSQPEEKIDVEITSKSEEIREVTTKPSTLPEDITSSKIEDPKSSKPVKRGRKPSTQEQNNPEIMETDSYKSSTEDKKSSTQSKEITPEKESKTKPARRGRKPSLQQEEQESEPSTPSRRTRQSSVQPEPKSEEPPKRGRRTSIQSEEQETPLTPRKAGRASVEPEIKTPTRITRRTSIDSESVKSALEKIDDEPQTPTRRTRRSSVLSQEQEVLTPTRRTRRTSVDSESVTSRQSALEKIEEYSATHRLTRRQKVMMEKNIEIQEMRKEGKVDLKVDKLDPINLMDKESFAGDPDPEENRPHSPTSSISSVGTRSTRRLSKAPTPEKSSSVPSLPSTPKRRRDVKASSASNIEQDSPTKSEESVSVKGKTKGKIEKAMASPLVKRKRRVSQESDTSDNASVISAVSDRLERVGKTESGKERHRSLSPTLLKPGTESESSKMKRKTRASILPKIELSKISEESALSNDSGTSKEKSSVVRRGRSKKDATPERC